MLFRSAIAGFRPPPSEERERVLTLLGDPLLVVASAGDGVISLYPTDGGVFGPYRGIEAEVASLPAEFARFDARGLLDSVRSGDISRRAFVTYETVGGESPGGESPHCPVCDVRFHRDGCVHVNSFDVSIGERLRTAVDARRAAEDDRRHRRRMRKERGK